MKKAERDRIRRSVELLQKAAPRPVAELIPYERNQKDHPAHQVEQIAVSLRRFGWRQPIVVDARSVIVIGHGRWLAAKSLGLETVPVVDADDLTPDEIRELRIVDNKLNESPWNDFLAEDLQELTFEGFTFPEAEVENGPDKESEPESTPDIVEDEAPEPQNGEPSTKKGTLYQLGRHRLLCGDSTDRDQVQRLMGGERADICFTSPPYNAMSGFHANPAIGNAYMREGGVYQHFEDNMTPQEHAALLSGALNNALEVTDDVLFNIRCTKGALAGTALFLGEHFEHFSGVINWEKTSAFTPVFECQYGMLSNRCEPIYTFNKDGRKKFLHPTWPRDKQMPNFVKTENGQGNKNASIHGATFPVSLAAWVIEHFTTDSVLDLFGGTGTTMIAAEQMGRTCYMMELDPLYCDVIIQRWEQFTGGKAVLLAE